MTPAGAAIFVSMSICHMHHLGNAMLLLLTLLLLMNGAQQSEYGWLPFLMACTMPYRMPYKMLCCAVLCCAVLCCAVIALMSMCYVGWR